jgi:hypothetical protein
MDWEEFKEFVREHWKIFLGVGLAVIVVIVVISVTLVFTLNKKDVSPTPAVSPFNGPADINGDPPKSGDNFGFPQFIANPDFQGTPSQKFLFSQLMFVHQAGYICAVASGLDGYPYLIFYNTDLNGNLKGPTAKIPLDFLPAGYVVCNGAFAPIYNVANEVYYLFISVGVTDKDSQTDIGNNYATHILLYTLDTNPNAKNALVWVQGNIQSTFTEKFGNVTALKIPLPSNYFTYNPTKPYYGTFGDKIQVVLDDNENITKQSLYVNGSEYDPNKPGGNLYWFILSDNTISPTLQLIRVIQDAKLLLLKQQTDAGLITCPVPPINIPGDYINGFASDFFVTSGNGKNNVLLIGNSTNQDYCALQNVDQPAAPKGYVQGFLPDSTNGWVQPQAGAGFFLYRYIGAATDTSIPNNGFGYSVSWINNHVIVGLAASPDTNPPKNAKFLVYDWVQQPFSAGALNLLGTIDPASGSTSPFIQTDLYPVSSNPQRYNLFSIDTGDSNNIMVTTWNQAPGNIISIQDPVVPNTQPFSTFALIQNIGADLSSNIDGSPPNTRFGFGQYTNTWISRTGKTIRMAINDPLFNLGVEGRIIVLTKNRTA